MGRPLGSKNKPRVTTPTIGVVVSKPVKVSKKEEVPLHLLDDTVPDPDDLPEQPEKDVISKEPYVRHKRGSSTSPKKLAEDVTFVIEELQHLREYVMRLEDLYHVTRNEETNTPEPIVSRKRRGKAEPNIETSDKIETVVNKESESESK